jgi:DNA-binding PadR family transcriptional regulator
VEKGKALLERIKTWEESLIQPRQETFQDVINFNNRLNAELMELKAFVDVAEPRVTQGAKERLADLLKEWESLKSEQQGIVRDGMAEYNELYLQLGLPALILEEE